MVTLAQSEKRRGSLILPWRTLSLTTLALVCYLFLGSAPEAWVFDRTAIVQGEWWRLVTGHWMHSDASHAFWNIGALMILGTLLEKRLQNNLILALVIGTFGVDFWLWWYDSTLRYYCGLSGILNALLAVGLVHLWYDLRQPLVWLVGLGAVAKIFVEISAGQALLTHTAWPSVPEVHAAGFLSGLVTSFATRKNIVYLQCFLHSRIYYFIFREKRPCRDV
jgi:rhomboid family GlyGly-CTERM serine protease